MPLDYDGIMDDTFVLRAEGLELYSNGKVASGSGRTNTTVERAINGHGHGQTNGTTGIGAVNGLKDQRKLTLRDNLLLFISRCVKSMVLGELDLKKGVQYDSIGFATPERGRDHLIR